MSASALRAEIEAGVSFWSWEDSGVLTGVMGIQPVRDVSLIRHAYVRTADQGRGGRQCAAQFSHRPCARCTAGRHLGRG